VTSRIAIITARGGSKRIPRKNIKLFFGKPMIAYVIEAAKSTNCFDEIMVSTDDEEIAEISLKYGASVPFYRSAENSDDYSSTVDVLFEVLQEYAKRGAVFTQACCLYPAAPFITADILIEGLKTMQDTKADALIPVALFSSPVWRALKDEDGKLKRIWPEYEMSRSQDLPKAYYDAGQFYWFDVGVFLNKKKILADNTAYLELNWSQVQDIDTPEDWMEAEFKYRFMNRLDTPK